MLLYCSFFIKSRLTIMITLKQLTHALAVGKTRHFKKAADLCTVSQSALSASISELEKQLGFQVFERDNRQVLVTPMGEQLLQRALKIKLDVDDLCQLSSAVKQPLSSPLSIGVIPTIGPYLLPLVLPELRRQYPNLHLTMVEEQSHNLVEAVKSGDLDTAILALPFDTTGLHTFEFWSEDFYCVLPKVRAGDTASGISAAELKDKNVLLLKDGHCLSDHSLAVCGLSKIDAGHSMSGTSLFTLVQMVAGNMGTTLVPAMALDSLLTEDMPVVVRHLDEPGPHRRLAFVTRLNYVRVGDVQVLKDLFRARLQLTLKPS